MTEFFYDLTPEKVIKAAESSGFQPTGHCFALNSYENRVYDVRLENSSNIIIKFYRPGRWTKDQIREEHEFLFDLKESEIPVCVPIIFSDGTTIRESSGIFYTVWPRTGGRSPEELTETELKILGRLLARIHNIGSSKKAIHRPEFNTSEYITKPLNFLLANNFIPSDYVRRYTDASEEISAIYKELSGNIPLHRIHGDCHKGNLLNGNDGWFFLDFDDFVSGPAIQDMWMLLPSGGEEAEYQRNILISAYREFREFEEKWLDLIEPLRTIRFIHYAGWIAKRWNDPAFPALFPHFGAQGYWEKETSDLENQLRLIHKTSIRTNPASVTETKEEPELTNKDFFWDM